jgi:hypothetical protein
MFYKLLVVTLASLMAVPAAFGQTGPSSLAANLNVQVFPKAGQDAAQQSKDEAECYEWAVTNSGVDPFDLQKKEAEQAQQAQQASEQVAASGQGAGARGAVKGAVAGAVIGEIADDDAGKGAAYGAAVGAVAARRGTRRAKEEAQAEISQQQQQTTQVTAEQMKNFKNAFGACLEGKNYIAKY